MRQHIRIEVWRHGQDNLRGIPIGLLSHILRELRGPGEMLYMCCGIRPVPGAVNVDIDPDSKADIICDVTRAPFKDGSYSFVLADPPYSGYDSEELYHCGIIPLYTLMEEMSRVTCAGGRYAILYPFRPQTLINDDLLMHIVTPGGVHRRPRVLSVFMRGMLPAYRYPHYNGRTKREAKS